MRNYKLLIALLFAWIVQAQRVEWVKPYLPVVPPARCCANMVYDSEMGSTLLFGGGISGFSFNDTWVFNRANGWIQLFPATSPPPTSGAAFAYDPLSKTAVLFGGNPANFVYTNDTWTWDGSTWTQQFPPVSPYPRAFDVEPMAFDAATGTSVLFGGFANGGSTVLGDTWIWNGLTKRWTERFPPTSPSPRATTVAYDYSTRQVMIFGGEGAGGVDLGDTWTWNGVTWTQRFPPVSPSPRHDYMMAYDANINGMVLFGGISHGEYLNDTWLWNGTTWRQLQTAIAPSPRTSAGIDYDPVFRGLVMFGGGSNSFLNETWIFIDK